MEDRGLDLRGPSPACNADPFGGEERVEEAHVAHLAHGRELGVERVESIRALDFVEIEPGHTQGDVAM